MRLALETPGGKQYGILSLSLGSIPEMHVYSLNVASNQNIKGCC